MKKVIKNKLYDTETATLIGSDSYGYSGDFNRWEETLYKKRTGEFFLYGEGGAASKYAVSVSNNEWCGGEKIIPLTYEAAREWAEKHLDTDDYLVTFGEPEEDDTKERLTITLPKAIISSIKQDASKAGLSLSAYLENKLKKMT